MTTKHIKVMSLQTYSLSRIQFENIENIYYIVIALFLSS